MSAMIQKIEQLKKEKKVVILAHYYTLPEVQQIADFVGDSLALVLCSEHRCRYYPFCGSTFHGGNS